jgi:hypothetical protein
MYRIIIKNNKILQKYCKQDIFMLLCKWYEVISDYNLILFTSCL